MTMRVTMTGNCRSEDGLSVLAIGTTYNVSDEFGAYLVRSKKVAQDTDRALAKQADALSIAEVGAVRSLVSGAGIADAASRDITAADNGQSLTPTVTLIYTIPAGLVPKPSFTVDGPAAGTITIAVSGGATSNGGTASLTRTRANNPVGFVVLAHAEADSYGVSGA